MKIFSIFFLITLSLNIQAQISISQSDMPSSGDTLRVSYALGTNNVDHTLTGANYTWDFSSLIPISQQVLQYNNVTTFPFFFIANHSIVNPSPDSLPLIGSVPNNFTDYFKNGSGGYSQVGSSFDYPPLGSFSIPIVYTSEDYIYEFPLQYNDIDSSDAAYAIQLPGIGYFGQERKRKTVVDGWGTLTTPFGTFQTLRVRSELTIKDTIAIDTLSVGFSTPRPLLIEYKWLTTSGKIPILEVEAQVFFNNTETVTNVIYRDSIRSNTFQVGIEETSTPADMGLNLYPNPSLQDVRLNYRLATSDEVQISVVDVNGRVVFQQSQGQQNAGSYTFELPTDRFVSGIYLLEVKVGQSQREAIRWIKQ